MIPWQQTYLLKFDKEPLALLCNRGSIVGMTTQPQAESGQSPQITHLLKCWQLFVKRFLVRDGCFPGVVAGMVAGVEVLKHNSKYEEVKAQVVSATSACARAPIANPRLCT